MRYRELPPRSKEGAGGRRTPRARLRIALTHARKLLEYAGRRQQRSDRIRNRKAKLHGALNNLDVMIWLAIATPRADVRELLAHLGRDALDTGKLATLVQALDAARAGSGRSGRPIAQAIKVLRGGSVAWLRAGRKDSYRWNDVEGRLTGALPVFIRDLFACCDGSHALVRSLDRVGRKRERALTMKDAALHSALKVALADIRQHHPRVLSVA